MKQNPHCGTTDYGSKENETKKLKTGIKYNTCNLAWCLNKLRIIIAGLLVVSEHHLMVMLIKDSFLKEICAKIPNDKNLTNLQTKPSRSQTQSKMSQCWQKAQLPKLSNT